MTDHQDLREGTPGGDRLAEPIQLPCPLCHCIIHTLDQTGEYDIEVSGCCEGTEWQITADVNEHGHLTELSYEAVG